MLADPKLKKYVDSEHDVIKTYDVPYVAGYSEDGKHIYIDRHVKLKFNGTDITKYLITHETTEKALLSIFKLDYQQAHHLATHAERQAVEADGHSWKDYEAHVEPYVKKLGHEKLDKVPKDLDLEPYRDEKDPEYKKLVDKIKSE